MLLKSSLQHNASHTLNKYNPLKPEMHPHILECSVPSSYTKNFSFTKTGRLVMRMEGLRLFVFKLTTLANADITHDKW